MWNSLPQRVVEVNGIDIFKKKLDKYMRGKGIKDMLRG